MAMRALLSVSDKTGLAPFAAALAGRGWELVSTGGTARTLAGAGLPVTAVSELTGFPEMLDGRVKTLHPRVHAGILARRHRADDREALAAHGITPIDLVVVNLYPFTKAAARADTPFDDLVEEIDIGGPSLVRAAAKNFRDVLVVVDPGDYERVLAALADPAGPSLALRFDLARGAFAHTADYDRMIASTLATVRVGEDGAVERPDPAHDDAMPAIWQPRLDKVRDLRYGENPHQTAAWYAEAPGPGVAAAGFGAATVHQGKQLSFTNLLDLDAAARIVLEFDEPAAVVIKHTNPCGAATAATAAEAYVRARDADALSAFGGIVGLNRAIDVGTARALTATFIEAVIAPGLDEAAGDEVRAILRPKANLRVVTAGFAGLDRARDARTILGAWLAQTRDRVVEAAAPWPGQDGPKVVTERAPTAEEWVALRFAWRVAAHVKSNTVLFTRRDVTLAIGAGQMSRVDAVRTAVMKADGGLAGSVAASDAFFPFRDGLDAVAAAGATAVAQPGGSVRDSEVIAAANEHGLAMVFTGRRHFRH
jgi:phosphoribosylaminoimidazolecarboxamide formyltransferase/IMP cyclohydrolase